MTEKAPKMVVLKPFVTGDKTRMSPGEDFDPRSVDQSRLKHYEKHGMVGPASAAAAPAGATKRRTKKPAPEETK